jgi:hypothetical protein
VLIRFERKAYFDAVRVAPFGGTMSADQVDGQEAILTAFELVQLRRPAFDLRWLAYALATTLHETASTMQPIEEYNGANQPYGKEDPETHQRYFGRGFRTNYP